MRYLTEEEVIAINFLIVDRYSPEEPKGVLSPDLLNSSLARPKQTVFGVYIPCIPVRGRKLHPILEREQNILQLESNNYSRSMC